MKIILVTIDTLRADRVGCYGYPKDTTPNMDRLASSGVFFKSAISSCTYTIPSHTAILTGKYPGATSVFFSQRAGFIDKDREIMLQEVFSDCGFETAAFLSSKVLRSSWGLNAGFGLYDDKMTAAEANRPEELVRPGAETNRSLFDWLARNKDKNFFAWVHYFDVHGPYVNPGPFSSSFRPEDYGPESKPLSKVEDGESGGIPAYQLLKVKKDKNGAVVDYERDARFYFAQYDAGVRLIDHLIGQLADELKRLGIYEDAVLVITSDHGEAMGENSVYFFHGLTVTPDQAKVPLIMKLPGNAKAGLINETPVSTIDIMPTLLNFAGIDAAGLGLDGKPLFEDGHGQARSILCENEWQRAIIQDGLFLVRDKDVIRDGFTNYNDAKDLCVGTRLFDTGTGKELDPAMAMRKKDLWDFSETLRVNVDPREVNIRIGSITRDILAREKQTLAAERDSVTKEKEILTHQRDDLLGEKARLTDDNAKLAEDNVRLAEDKLRLAGEEDRLRVELTELQNRSEYQSRIIQSMVNSKSWKLTYPIRRISGIIKGIKP